MSRSKNSTRSHSTATRNRKRFEKLAAQYASLIENDDTPEGVAAGIKDHLLELLSVVPIWNPRVIRACYAVLCEEATNEGVDVAQEDMVAQHVTMNPEKYGGPLKLFRPLTESEFQEAISN